MIRTFANRNHRFRLPLPPLLQCFAGATTVAVMRGRFDQHAGQMRVSCLGDLATRFMLAVLCLLDTKPVDPKTVAPLHSGAYPKSRPRLSSPSPSLRHVMFDIIRLFWRTPAFAHFPQFWRRRFSVVPDSADCFGFLARHFVSRR